MAIKAASDRLQHTVYLNLKTDADVIAALDYLAKEKSVAISHYLRSALREKLVREKLLPATKSK